MYCKFISVIICAHFLLLCSATNQFGGLGGSNFGAGFGTGFGASFGNQAQGGNAYGGAGEGEVTVTGELPVSGTAGLSGQVPIQGGIQFRGEVPAAGAVTITGRCECAPNPNTGGFRF